MEPVTSLIYFKSGYYFNPETTKDTYIPKLLNQTNYKIEHSNVRQIGPLPIRSYKDN